MIKKILIIAGVGFILSLSLFSGISDLLFQNLIQASDTIKYMPLELRVVFFAGWLALLWALYNAVVS